MVKSVAILTSGGDAPGMNAAVRSVARSCMYYDMEVYAVYHGYKGLVEDEIVQMDRRMTRNIINLGGTILKTARYPEFKDPAVRKIAADNLRARGIDALVVIGGDGSYKGMQGLEKEGIACIGLPGTIDNDISSTEFTIGFDTALNTVVEAIDKLRDTSSSHQRCTVLEVMGRHCGDLALWSGIASGTEMVITSETGYDRDAVMETLKQRKASDKKHAIVVISEKLTDVDEMAKDIQASTGFECRANVLGHLQRGGRPTAFDRVLAARLGVYAVELLKQGVSGRCVGIHNNQIVNYDIETALSMPRIIDVELLKITKMLG